ncbi:proline-rich proteoglycan 2-like [Branchiostoma floridae]|uniref:1-alkyl-2-acetylglycerophosphocholine esterase n=1 Tax=Branchiostoma floridae TaxID=7739 RepID=A0A9J7N3E7_BRAFL|nr:proline-rich proteoglycan 2-like [Branchiostoma floridae]
MPPDVLILGDSNTKPIKPDVMYPDKRVTKEITYNITQATDHIQQSTMPAPKVILFHIGTNDVRDKRDPTAVSEGFRKLIQTSRDKFPHTPLVFSAIPPRRDSKLQEIGEQVNSFLNVVSEETSYVHVTDNSNLSNMGTIKEALYCQDGYHLNRFGTRVMVSNIKRVVNPIIGLGNYSSKGTRANFQSLPGQCAVPPRFYQHPANGQRQPPRSLVVGSQGQSQGLPRSPNAPASNQRSTVLSGRAVGTFPASSPSGQPNGQPRDGGTPSPAPPGRPAVFGAPASGQPDGQPRGTPPPAPPGLPAMFNAPASGQPDGQPRGTPSPAPPGLPAVFGAPASGQPDGQLRGTPSPAPPGRPAVFGAPARDSRLQPSQRSGPWGSPPPFFNFPPAPWGLPPPNTTRMAPPPWPWHPALMWPPMPMW